MVNVYFTDQKQFFMFLFCKIHINHMILFQWVIWSGIYLSSKFQVKMSDRCKVITDFMFRSVKYQSNRWQNWNFQNRLQMVWQIAGQILDFIPSVLLEILQFLCIMHFVIMHYAICNLYLAFVNTVVKQ